MSRRGIDVPLETLVSDSDLTVLDSCALISPMKGSLKIIDGAERFFRMKEFYEELIYYVDKGHLFYISDGVHREMKASKIPSLKSSLKNPVVKGDPRIRAAITARSRANSSRNELVKKIVKERPDMDEMKEEDNTFQALYAVGSRIRSRFNVTETDFDLGITSAMAALKGVNTALFSNDHGILGLLEKLTGKLRSEGISYGGHLRFYVSPEIGTYLLKREF